MNWRRIVVTGLVAGMVTVTGCASNLPETNQGNRNGQRVADAVNHRPDSYRSTNINENVTRNSSSNIAQRATRGINRIANDLSLGRPNGRVGNATHNVVKEAEVANVNQNVTRATTGRTNRAARRYGMNFRGKHKAYGEATKIGIAPEAARLDTVQTVPVMLSQNAFFRKNETAPETPPVTPAVPAPTSSLSYYDYNEHNDDYTGDDYTNYDYDSDEEHDDNYEGEAANTVRVTK